MAKPSVIGIDIGGTKTAIVEGTADGFIWHRDAFPTQADQPYDVLVERLRPLLASFVSRGTAEGRKPVAISISVGGPLRIRDAVLINPPHLPGWHGVNLGEAFRPHASGLPVFVEHDGNAGALAEYYFGVGKPYPDLQHLIFLTFGTGLGAGFIINGRLLHGASDTAGEVGHWRLANEGPIGFGKHGSWEGFASGRGLVSLASLRYPHRWTMQTPIRDLIDSMLSGDADAVAVATEAGEWMGRGIALLIDALNPEVVALGSLGRVLGDLIIEPAKRIVAIEALPQAAAAVQIVPAILGKQIGDVASIMAGLVGLKLV